MTNLSIEGLSKITQTGDAEKLLGGHDNLQIERNVTREMQNNGMEMPGISGAEGPQSFTNVLKNSMDQVNTYQKQADTAIKEMVAGRNKNIHETMLTVERADSSLKLMMQVRNKVLDAYREIMRMQV